MGCLVPFVPRFLTGVDEVGRDLLASAATSWHNMGSHDTCLMLVKIDSFESIRVVNHRALLVI